MENPTVVAACDLAVNFVFGPTATYRPIGSAADTAFSGSAVIELEVLVVIPKTTKTTTTNGKNNAHNTNTTRVVLKHSSDRTLSKSFVTTGTSDEENDTIKSSKKYAAALKVDRSSRNEYAFLQSYSEKLLLQLPPNNIDIDDGISSISNKNKDKNDDAGEIKIKLKTKTRIPRTLFARNHPTEGITLLLESLSSFGDSCGNDNDNNKDDNSSNQHSSDTNADNNNDETKTTSTTTTSSSTSSGGRVTAIPLGPKMNATLEWIANFHANFLPRSLNPNTFLNNDDNDNSDSDLAVTKEEVQEKEKEKVKEEEKKSSSLLWSIGTHHSLEKRSPIELQQLPIDLTEFVERFQNNENENDNNNDGCCSYFQTPPAKQQGQRIQDVAVDVAHYLHPDNNPAHKTIVHGDYKQGNMFFAANTNNNNNTAVTSTATSSSRNKDIDIDIDDAAHDQKLAVFDWQWTGPGLGATDLVYLCVMAVSDEALVDYETTIVRPYHNYLLQALLTTRNNNKNHSNIDGTTTSTNNNNNNNDDDDDDDDDELYPYNELLKEFKIAMIDLQRWMGGSRYISMTLESVQKAANQSPIDVNHGIFRRSIKRLVWIFKIVDLALDDIESGRIQLIA